jgi:hypothetical protein
MYQPLCIDREQLTIEGVTFDNIDLLEKAANAIGSNMFEGFSPSPKSIEIIRDYLTGKISLIDLIQIAKTKAYLDEK